MNKYKKSTRRRIYFYNINDIKFIFIFLAGIFFACIFIYIFYFKRIIINKKFIYNEIYNLNRQIKEKHSQLSAYSVYHEKLKNLRKKLLFFPVDIFKKNYQNKPLVVVITDHKLPSTLRLDYLKLHPSKDHSNLSVLSADIIVVGNEKNINEFFYRIINIKCPFSLKKFKWEFFNYRDDDLNKKLKLSLLLDIYQIKKNDFYNAILEELQLNTTNNKSAKFTDEKFLKYYPINQFKMIGFLNGGFFEKKWALLESPNKQVYKVELDDELGLEQGRIIFFDEKKVIIQERDNKKIELNIND